MYFLAYVFRKKICNKGRDQYIRICKFFCYILVHSNRLCYLWCAILCINFNVQVPYTQKFLWYEIFAQQEANRIFTIIFLWITGPSWKGNTCYVLLQISNCCKPVNFHGLNFRCIHKWPWNLQNLHTAEISVHTV